MKPMNSDDQKRTMARLAEGRRIVTKRYRNPVYGSRSLSQNVEEEMGNPAPARVDKKEAAKKAMDKFFNKGPGVDVSNLPRASGVGNPHMKKSKSKYGM